MLNMKFAEMMELTEAELMEVTGEPRPCPISDGLMVVVGEFLVSILAGVVEG